MEARLEKRYDPHPHPDCRHPAHTIAGAAIIENVFNINGMGNLMVQCITKRDFNWFRRVFCCSRQLPACAICWSISLMPM